ncbi:AT-hook motif nuclear-localized protein [Heracleum sosnowskyi]|uniref:AT-hook motif nuclear-localized protein n=1 Tax=Heracleum sosnowskyi TaxID=360622 RepID=A0AAD8HEF3_9APIA|nr:AT-hook motif nuclear-localized protein [Heracleum sosnowskyi]
MESPPPHHHQQPPHHHQQPPQHHQQQQQHQQLLHQQQQVMMMSPPLNSYPQIQNNNGNTNNSNNNMNIDSASVGMMQHDPNRFSYNSSDPKPLEAINSQYSDGSAGFSMEPARKKRGRPRKYSADGNIALGLSPVSAVAVGGHGEGNSGGSGTGGVVAGSEGSKKGRGRPPGSGKKQLDALGTYGVGFTPHVITVNAGEDVAAKIMAFSQQGPRTVCILSANGAISNVTLRQPATSGGTVSYEGRFEIISLSGSLSMSDSNGNNRTNVLSVSLAGTDGRVLGGGVAGVLLAATPVQVIVGSFIADGKKPKSGLSPAPPPHMLNFGAQVPGVSPSEGGSSESSDESGSSPLNQGPGSYSNASQPMQPMPVCCKKRH